jgi:hypothetical protein
VGWTRLNALPITSGAFGLFQHAAVEEVGGWATDTVGEDMELVVRLHCHFRARALPYRIEFVAQPGGCSRWSIWRGVSRGEGCSAGGGSATWPRGVADDVHETPLPRGCRWRWRVMHSRGS